jgi:alpha-1,3/alpha-1,6-mannosyltransferase
VLKLLKPGTKVLFYCHFPDQLLSERNSLAKSLYRAPFDWVEETTTGMADGILVNSNFTKTIVAETFGSLQSRLGEIQVLYPCIDVASFPDT